MQVSNPVVSILGANITEIGSVAVPLGDGQTGNNTMRIAVAASSTGDSFACLTPTDTLAHQLVAPASNVNGILVKTGSSISITQSSASAALATGTLAPTSTASNENLLFGTVVGESDVLSRDIFIPAGGGLWSITSLGSSSTSCVRYKVL